MLSNLWCACVFSVSYHLQKYKCKTTIKIGPPSNSLCHSFLGKYPRHSSQTLQVWDQQLHCFFIVKDLWYFAAEHNHWCFLQQRNVILTFKCSYWWKLNRVSMFCLQQVISNSKSLFKPQQKQSFIYTNSEKEKPRDNCIIHHLIQFIIIQSNMEELPGNISKDVS